QVKASADKWFAQIPKAGDPPRPAASAQEPEQTKQRSETVEPGQIGLTMIGWHVPPARDKDVYALTLTSIMLGAGESSRLKLRLKAVDPKTKQPLALDGGSQAVIREDPGLIVAVGAYLRKDQALPVQAAILDEIARLGKQGPSPTELRKAKNQVQSSFVS